MPPKWGSAGAAAANTSLVLLLYITPSAPGSSIFVQVNLVSFCESTQKPSPPSLLPFPPQPAAPQVPLLQRKAAANTSLRHAHQANSYFLHCQERVLQEREQQMEEGAGEQGRATAGGRCCGGWAK
ncbi:unnamed protein product [Closterium sp. Naga37s-1]|nr:unnamed protein product [Closterium sp. Naga37s-1]